jgi:hypothetical protein
VLSFRDRTPSALTARPSSSSYYEYVIKESRKNTLFCLDMLTYTYERQDIPNTNCTGIRICCSWLFKKMINRFFLISVCPCIDTEIGRSMNLSARSPSSSPERRVVRARILSPPLPPASPPAMRVLLPRMSRHTALRSRPRTVPDVDTLLPIITGI